jgi:uncharacterized protein (DUF983 family)
MSTKAIWTGIRRGLCRRCPNCGQGDLFRGFLTVCPRCKVCAEKNSVYPSDDMPPYLTIAIVGHLVVPLSLWMSRTSTLPLWAQFSIWLPLTVLLSVGLLPFVKGGVIGLCWATGVVRPNVG